MKVTICSSASLAIAAYEVAARIERAGHEILIYPRTVEVSGRMINVEEYHRLRKHHPTPYLLDIKQRLARDHLYRVQAGDAILVYNEGMNSQGLDIGGNTFLEIGIAFFFGKRIFLWKKPLDCLPYYEEIAAFSPKIIEGDISRIA
jgi:hypothetical protein